MISGWPIWAVTNGEADVASKEDRINVTTHGRMIY